MVNTVKRQASLTTRATYTLVPLLLIAAAAEGQQVCSPYEPTEAGEVISSTWAQPFERDNYAFTVPADPGGGYVIARIETTAPSRPQMRMIPPSGQGVVSQAAPSFPGPSPQILEVAFEVDAGSTFNVEIFEDAVSSQGAFPVPYTWSWDFVSRVDCYEPNDGLPSDWPATVAASRTVSFDQVLEAYSLAGHQTYDIPAFEAHSFDWYDFTLAVPTEIWLATLSVPADQRIRLRLFDSVGGVVLDQVAQTGETAVIGPTLLQPGTYYFDLHPEIRGESNVTLSEGELLPDHFDQPYRFIVSTADPTSAGP